MPTIEAIVGLLREIGEVETVHCGSEFPLSQEISGIRPDTVAGHGDIAWLSGKQLGRAPSRLGEFRGSLLLCPEDAGLASNDQSCFAPCKRPKLAMIRVIEEFFVHLTGTNWPATGQTPVSEDAKIASDVTLGHGVVIGPGTVIDSNVVVAPNTVICWTRIESGSRIGANCSIGLPGFGYEQAEDGRYVRFPHVGKIIIERGVEIGSCVCIDRGAIGDTVIRQNSKIDNLVHVAHNVEIGENSLVIANSMLGGSARIGSDAWIAPSASIMNQASVGKGSIIGMGAVVLKNVEERSVMVGNPAKLLKKVE